MKIETKKKRDYGSHEEVVIVLESIDEVAFLRDVLDAWMFTIEGDDLQPIGDRETFINRLKELCETKLK